MLARSPCFSSTTVSLEKALRKARKAWRPTSKYPMRMCSVFWTDVFIRYYGEPPFADSDPRWNTLFKMGFKLLRELNTPRT